MKTILRLWPDHLRTEGPRDWPTDHKPDGDVVIRQIHEVGRRELRAELLGKERWICRTEAEEDRRPDVAEDELGNFSLEELEADRPKGLPIERDIGFEPTSLGEIRKIPRVAIKER